MLIDFLHGKVFDTLSDLVRSCRLPWRRAEDLIVISSHGGPLRLVAKAKNSYHSPTPIIETEGMITSTGSPPQLKGATTIIVVDSVAERRAVSRKLGADFTVDFKKVQWTKS